MRLLRRVPGGSSRALALAFGAVVLAGTSSLVMSRVASAQVSQVSPAEDALPRDPRALLDAAFSNQYEVDLTSTIDLVMRNGTGHERRRRFETASKIIEGRLHSIGRLVYPDHLRGMTILEIEAKERGHDAFVYLPSMKAIRRITTAQRGDSFFGTDITYEDLERRRAADYEIVSAEAGLLKGEAVLVIRARPQVPLSYYEVRFSVATADAAMLEVRYFKRGDEEPFRIISAPRETMQDGGGHVLPTRLVARNLARGTTTEVLYRDLVVGAPIDDRIFSLRTLEQKRAIPRGTAGR